MRLRTVILVLLLVGGFWFITTHVSNPLGNFAFLNAGGSGSPLELTEAHAAPAYDNE
jgi:hypothetical protein